METLTIIIVAILGSSGFTALVLSIVNRRKNRIDTQKTIAETEQLANNTRQTETVYYQQRVEETIKQMRLLETQVKELKSTIESAQTQYEQRVGTLHTKIDGLVVALERANAALDVANKTIVQLRQEVKDGNIIITELRKEITQLLVDRAEKKQQ